MMLMFTALDRNGGFFYQSQPYKHDVESVAMHILWYGSILTFIYVYLLTIILNRNQYKLCSLTRMISDRASREIGTRYPN